MFLTVLNVFKMKDIYEVREESLENALDEEIAVKAAAAVVEKARTGKLDKKGI
jgi:hypothetical protein